MLSIARRGGIAAYSIKRLPVVLLRIISILLGRYRASATASGRPSPILILYPSPSQEVGTYMLSIEEVCTADKVGFVAPAKKKYRLCSDRPDRFCCKTLHGCIFDTLAWHGTPMDQQENR